MFFHWRLKLKTAAAYWTLNLSQCLCLWSYICIEYGYEKVCLQFYFEFRILITDTAEKFLLFGHQLNDSFHRKGNQVQWTQLYMHAITDIQIIWTTEMHTYIQGESTMGIFYWSYGELNSTDFNLFSYTSGFK
jgi:hypothetical protein